jgi:hypothetical protein
MSALIVAAAFGCTPDDGERCGESGKYFWDTDWNACFELGADPPPDTNSNTNPPDTDSVVEGLGDPCSDGPKLNAGGCETKEANFCAYYAVGPNGPERICTVLCSDLAGHSDCPDDYYCCDFIVIANTPDHCIPSDWWSALQSPGTCANWTKP